MGKPQSFEEMCSWLRNQPDQVVITYRDIRNGGIKNQAGHLIWEEKQDAKAKKSRDEDLEKIKKIKQERESEHTLLVYWKLAHWDERFGMLSFLSGIFLFGYLCSKVSLASRLIDLIMDVTP